MKNIENVTIANIIGYTLLGHGVFFMISSVIHSLKGIDGTELWFSRLIISLICFGFSGIILKMKN